MENTENKIGAVVILFNPDIDRLNQNLLSIKNQVDSILLVDNNSENIEEINELIKRIGIKIHLIKNKKNMGIAYALNQGMKFFENLGCNWVVTLDQDSVSPTNLISEFYNQRETFEKKENIGIYCPVIQDMNRKEKISCTTNSTKTQYISKCITSGSITNIIAWRKIDGFDEKLFIDLVDFDFCDRLIKQGYKIVQLKDVLLMHEIGKIKQYNFILKTITVMNHSPFRKYYMCRNLIYISRKNQQSTFKSLLKSFKILSMSMIFEKEKKSKFQACFKGVIDGYRMELDDGKKI